MPQQPTEHHTNPELTFRDQGSSNLTVLFWTLLGLTTLVRLVYGLKLPLTGDEAYFWEWGRHPALGYYDHPPVAGWILWLTRQILGESVAAVRIPAVLAGTMVIAVIHRFALDISVSARTAALTGLLAMGIPLLSVLGILYSTDTPVLAAGTLGGYLFYRAVNSGEIRFWIWTGVCFALVLGSKFLGIPILGAAALYMLLNSDARRHLRTAGPYAAAGITLLGIVPPLLWNAANNWATFTFNFASRHSAAPPGFKGVLDYLAGQAFALSPMVFILAIPLLAAAVPVWRANGHVGNKISAFFALAPLGGFLALSPLTKIGIHWPAVAVPFLAVALGTALSSGTRLKKNYIAAALMAWCVTLILFLLPLAPYLLPSDWAHPLRPNKINTAQLEKAMGSPEESGLLVGQALEALERQGNSFVFTRSYALSSLAAFYTPGNPEVTVLGKGSVHGRNHLLWFDPADHKGQSAVFVSYKPVSSERKFIEARFRSWETVIDSDGPEGSFISIVKCYGYKGIR